MTGAPAGCQGATARRDSGFGIRDSGLGMPPGGPSNRADKRKEAKRVEGAENLVG